MTSPLPPLDDCPVAIKPLEWRGSVSECPFGEYSVERDFDDAVSEAPWCCWAVNESLGHFATLPDAKAAAQADYEQRIRSALVPVAAPVAAGSDEVPAAWLGYHPETNHTGTTELRSVAEMWEQDGIEVTPLYVSTITADKAEIARLRGEFQKMTAAWRASCIAAEASESRCAALTEALKTVPLWIRLMINSGSWDARTLERVDQELSGIARSALDAVTLREIDSLLSTDAALEAQERTA